MTEELKPEAAPVEPLCPFTDRPAWECAAACTCAHFKPTGIIKHAHPPAAPTDALVEKAARALATSHGLDFDEVCGIDANPEEGECDSGTCIAALYEDHDADYARAMYRADARAALAAMQEAGE